MTTAPPILVVGAVASGASILACSLGEHPRIELAWASGRTAAGGSRHPSLRAGKARWVDGSPEATVRLASLLDLIPDVRVIHVLRDPDDAVGASAGMEPDALYERWTGRVLACAAIADSLGSSALTVTFEALLGDPEDAVGACLRFLGEEYSRNCLRPFLGAVPRAKMKPPGESPTALRARELGASLRLRFGTGSG